MKMPPLSQVIASGAVPPFPIAVNFNLTDSNHEFVKIIHGRDTSDVERKEGARRRARRGVNYFIILSQPPEISCSIISIIAIKVILTDRSLSDHELTSAGLQPWKPLPYQSSHSDAYRLLRWIGFLSISNLRGFGPLGVVG